MHQHAPPHAQGRDFDKEQLLTLPLEGVARYASLVNNDPDRYVHMSVQDAVTSGGCGQVTKAPVALPGGLGSIDVYNLNVQVDLFPEYAKQVLPSANSQPITAATYTTQPALSTGSEASGSGKAGSIWSLSWDQGLHNCMPHSKTGMPMRKKDCSDLQVSEAAVSGC
jgi:hypothetical protein